MAQGNHGNGRGIRGDCGLVRGAPFGRMDRIQARVKERGLTRRLQPNHEKITVIISQKERKVNDLQI